MPRAAFEAGPADYRAPRRLALTLCNRSITDGLSPIDGVAREYTGLAVC